MSILAIPILEENQLKNLRKTNELYCSSDLEDTAGLKLLATSTVSGPASAFDSKHFGLLVIRIMSMMDKIIRMMAMTMWIGNNDGVCGFQVTF